jgi:hypothetical protein
LFLVAERDAEGDDQTGEHDALLAQLDHRRMGPWLAVDPQERSLGGDDRLELVAEVRDSHRLPE